MSNRKANAADGEGGQARWWQIWRRLKFDWPDDIRWWIASAAIALVGFIIQLSWSDAREKGAGILFLLVGLNIGLVRFLVGRISRVENVVNEKLPRLAEDADVHPLRSEIWHEETVTHHRRLESIRHSHVGTSSQEDLYQYLTLLTAASRTRMKAIDHITLERWFGEPALAEYLARQLSRVKNDGIELVRIKFVRDGDLTDEQLRATLAEFVKMHDENGAKLFLCSESLARSIDTIFFPRMGCLVIDDDLKPAALLGRLDEDGYIKKSDVYLRRHEPVEQVLTDFKKVLEKIRIHGADIDLRAELKSRPIDAQPIQRAHGMTPAFQPLAPGDIAS